jgi:hypothetical protein
MRLIIIPLLSILIFSCSSKQSSTEDQLSVVAAVFVRIPKTLPPPPPPLINNEVKEEDNIDYSQLKPLTFNYAINENFVYYDFDYINEISNQFMAYKSKELFEEKGLDSSYMKLVQGLSGLKKSDKIDKAKLSELINDDLIFWDKQKITIQEKKELNITGIISFSRVSFNDEFTKAAVAVGDYSEHIGGGVSLYILEKIDNNWVIKYTKVLMMS